MMIIKRTGESGDRLDDDGSCDDGGPPGWAKWYSIS